MCVQTSVMFTLLYVMRKCLFKDLHPTFCEVKYVYYLSFYWSMVWKKILIYSQWILNTYNGKVLHYFLLWALFVNTFIKCKHLVGRNGRPKQESDQANVSRVPDVAKGYPILLSHQSQSHQQVSFLYLTVSDAVESLISFQYQEENMTKTTKNIKVDLLVYRSKFFLAKRGWGERKKGYTL